VLLAIVFTVVAWASAFIGIRVVGASYPPGALALGRLLVGAVALGATLLISRRGWVPPTAREWGFLALCGLSWFAVYNVVLNAAETHLDAGTTAMLVNIGPILIAVFAGLFLGEGFPRWLVIGALIAFAGVLVVGFATSTGAADLIGVVLSLAAAVTYAIGLLAQKPVLRRLPALQVTFTACAVGVPACLPFAGQLVSAAAVAPIPATLGVAYLGLVPTALAFSTWAYALARSDAGRLGVTTYVVPPLAIVASALLLGELPAPLAVVGGLISLVGVALSRRRAVRREPPAAVRGPASWWPPRRSRPPRRSAAR
jgi:drug/metabolite transporter (DMT)-like permease